MKHNDHGLMFKILGPGIMVFKVDSPSLAWGIAALAEVAATLLNKSGLGHEALLGCTYYVE